MDYIKIIDKFTDRISVMLLPIISIFAKYYPDNKEIVVEWMTKIMAIALNRAINKVYPNDSKGDI